MSWASIANYAKKVEQVVGKVASVVGKDVNTAIQWFDGVEPYASATIAPFFPEAAVVLAAVYKVTSAVESGLAVPGATKLQQVQSTVVNGVIPALQYGLGLAGKTMDAGAAATASTDLINAVVAENNAQAVVSELIGAALASGKLPDTTALATAQAAVSKATTAVIAASTAIQATVKSVVPVAA